uniref:Uncharacterized protein n=1 Tax=Anguilla anguilla TaxID=7936 RepID=A0A0E9TX31_ANGAN
MKTRSVVLHLAQDSKQKNNDFLFG